MKQIRVNELSVDKVNKLIELGYEVIIAETNKGTVAKFHKDTYIRELRKEPRTIGVAKALITTSNICTKDHVKEEGTIND